MDKDKQELISKLYNIKTEEELNYFKLSEEERLKSRNLDKLSGNKCKTDFLKDLQAKLSGVPDMPSILDIRSEFKAREIRDMRDIKELQNKIIDLLDSDR